MVGSDLVIDEQSFSSDHIRNDFMEGIDLKGKAFSSLISPIYMPGWVDQQRDGFFKPKARKGKDVSTKHLLFKTRKKEKSILV